MPDILNRLGREVLVCDGAMGTMLQRAGVPPEQCPEQLNLTAPEIIEGIHCDYVLTGADCVTTNTFGGNRLKLAEWGLADEVHDLNVTAVRIARRAGAQHVLGGMGPTGRTLRPLGDTTFDEMFDVFAEQAAALAEGEPDAILIETMSDIAEARCALMAARSACDLPVFVTVTFGVSGRMDLSGTDPEAAAVVLEAAGAAAVGMNCGLGPEQMLPLVEAMADATALPIIVQPNAGLPRLEDGRTVFPGTAEEMGALAARFVDAGASVVGSCCGSTPAFTGAISDVAKERSVRTDRSTPPGVVIAGPRSVVRIGRGHPLAVVGERVNPTGRRPLADSLRAGSMAVVRELAVDQQAEGARLIDVNVGIAGGDAAALLPEAVEALTGVVDAPLVLDEADPVALEAALRTYPGRALVNSVTGSAESLETVLPLAARYGAALVVLVLDDEGIPATVEGRLAILDRVRRAAADLGLGERDLVVDSLVMTAATDHGAPDVTLGAVKAASGQGLATILGVSNVSHGLPGRSILNAAFLRAAASAGLDAAIADPGDRAVMQAVAEANAARDVGADTDAHGEVSAAWRAALKAALTGSMIEAAEEASAAVATTDVEKLAAAVARGDAEAAPKLVDSLVAVGTEPSEVIEAILTPAIQRLGDAFGRGEVFLPQLMVAADAMKAAVDRAKGHLPDGGLAHAGRVAFGTVKGDIHSIGKDICLSLLESQGFVVDDLGVDVPLERFVEAANSADVVCVSALMTTTLRNMEQVVGAIAETSRVPVLVGGAVVNAEWAASIGAGYASDAPGCVQAVRRAVEGKDARSGQADTS